MAHCSFMYYKNWFVEWRRELYSFRSAWTHLSVFCLEKPQKRSSFFEDQSGSSFFLHCFVTVNHGLQILSLLAAYNRLEEMLVSLFGKKPRPSQKESVLFVHDRSKKKAPLFLFPYGLPQVSKTLKYQERHVSKFDPFF